MTNRENSWTAYLSDGRSINEKDLYVRGEVLPFKKLVRLCNEQGVQVASMTLNVSGVRYNSPSRGVSSSFQSAIAPEKFWIYYRSRFLMLQSRENSFIGLSWKAGDFRTTLWVSTDNPRPISWFEIKKAEGREEDMINDHYKGLKP